jgi:hypothetical protein
VVYPNRFFLFSVFGSYAAIDHLIEIDRRSWRPVLEEVGIALSHRTVILRIPELERFASETVNHGLVNIQLPNRGPGHNDSS